ncbi:MAG TPA: chemotaxis protein CheD [Bryobacteraceae bacterium]|nr:chemotaxis protein CheD [Bryobacteraceae bacterium]
MEQIVVQMADCRVADVPGQVLATYALGSCIGLAVHDPKANVGGLLHFMLPDSGIDPARGRDNPFMFADTGIPLLLEQVCSKGASKQRLMVHAAGGARMMDRENVFEIGKRNYLAMRKILWKKGILVHAEAVGGANSRTVRLQIGTGRVWLQEAGEQRELVAAPPQRGATNGLSALDRR